MAVPPLDISLAESNAIAQYLVDRYDKEQRFTVKGTQDEYLMAQWLFFQSATQGPIFQQVRIPWNVLQSSSKTHQHIRFLMCYFDLGRNICV